MMQQVMQIRLMVFMQRTMTAKIAEIKQFSVRTAQAQKRRHRSAASKAQPKSGNHGIL